MNKKFLLLLSIWLGVPGAFAIQRATSTPSRLRNAELMNKTTYAMMHLTVMARMYGSEHNGKLPPMQNPIVLKQSLLPYGGKADFISPATGQPFKTNPTLSGRSIKSVRNSDVLFYDAKPISGPNNPKDMVRVVGRIHGSIAMPESTWQRVKKEAGIR